MSQNELRETILAIASRYTTLHQQGTRWWGLCPFHQENTPSFTISVTKGLFYCFGCKRGGDGITLLREVGGYTFAEAAALVGKDLPARSPALRHRVRQLTLDFTRWREQRWMRAYQVLWQARRRLVGAQDVQRFYQLAPSTFTETEVCQAVTELQDALLTYGEAAQTFLFFGPDGPSPAVQQLWARQQGQTHGR